jgi:hypothetical protein
VETDSVRLAVARVLDATGAGPAGGLVLGAVWAGAATPVPLARLAD